MLIVSDKTSKFACSTEAIWLNIKALGSPCLDVLIIYRPPRIDRVVDTHLLEQLENFSSRPNVMIKGDFNAPGINWSTVQSSCPKSTFDYVFLQKTLKALLTQHVPFPTRTREGQRANCLDLVFTKTSGSIDEIISMPPLGRSDHVVLMWDYSLFSVAPAIEEKRRNVWRGNFHQMRADLTDINWTSMFSSTVNEDWESFRNVLLQLMDNHCPLTSVHHSKLFTNEARFLHPAVDNPPTASISHTVFSESLIRKEFKELKESKSPVPDELPPKLLKELANELSAPLWIQALEDSHAVHIAFIDFQKAFDTVTHERLLYKLERIGIRIYLFKWIENFLVGRRQVVCIGQERSSSAAVDSGVP
ncbi:unnamed protein product [Schistocephalus solidus]|uniref:Reverse transcriptase domain-containing protein n=1 Tax=Schistocephalus solidus TaxID=70667 RepID=A0A183TT00_SCHSO|nr:unnamed protein product [Schistocephalus solidus]